MSNSITDLRFCEKDARDVYDVLTDKCGYEPNNMMLLTGSEANRENILNILDNLANPTIYPNADTVIFYFS